MRVATSCFLLKTGQTFLECVQRRESVPDRVVPIMKMLEFIGGLMSERMLILKNETCGQLFEANEKKALPTRCARRDCNKTCVPDWKYMGVVEREEAEKPVSKPERDKYYAGG